MDVAQIEIVANGQTYQIALGTPLPAFLEQRGQAVRRVVVERNGEALTPAEAEQTTLAAGDRLEIVRIVAGG
ncbi:MAG: sulfur carrier protein ThiS [Verrucomicrobiota bacterium JB022]|nr:sulfur carrier protein ThiS [Verrucomicrobiota bacterium JB022]